MNWDDLRFVLAVGRARTLARAARDLRVDATTVGRRLATIEEALGTRLFDRTPDGFEATQPGLLVQKRAREMEIHSLAVEREVKGMDARPAGLVKIAALDLLIDEFVIPRVPALQRLHPDLVISVVSGLGLADLTRQEADLAIRATEPKHPDLIGQPLGTQAIAMYKVRGFTWTGPAPLICGPEAWDNSSFVKTVFALFPEYRITARVNSEGHGRNLVRAGVGLGAIDCFSGDGTPDLERALPEPFLRETLWLVTHVDSHRSARVRAVSRFLIDEFATAAARMNGEGDG